MTRREFVHGGASAAFLPGARAAGAAPIKLFNGRDLEGWRKAGHGVWSIEEGAITGRFDNSKPGPGYLFTAGEFADFDLRLEFWISRQGNSGIYVRQPWREFGTTGDHRPAHAPGDGVEIQIDYHDPKNMTGAVYNVHPPSSVRGGEERWVAYRIVCTGPAVEVWIDGERVNRYQPLASPRGAIGFQIHGQQPHDHVVRFRNIELT